MESNLLTSFHHNNLFFKKNPIKVISYLLSYLIIWEKKKLESNGGRLISYYHPRKHI